jgi:hypothetical protein
MAFDTGAGME